MSLAHFLLSTMSPFVLFALIMACTAILTVTATLIFHRFVPHHKLKMHNDIAGPIFSTLGVIYAVILAFMVVVVWQGFDRAKLNADMEVNCLSNLRIDSEPFEEDFRGKIRGGIDEYTKAVIGEWDMHAKGLHDSGARKAIEKLVISYSGYSPRTEGEKAFFDESIELLNKLFELRLMRLSAVSGGIHPLLWMVLILGGIITIVFTIFFGTDNLRAKIIMSTLLAVTISLVLFTILEYSLPFTGSAIVPCDSFKELLTQNL